MRTKQCTKCAETKALEGFTKSKASKDGYRGECKECTNAYRRGRYASNDALREYHEQYRAEHRERNKEYFTQYNRKNKTKRDSYNRSYYADNKEAVLDSNSRWRKDNRRKAQELQNRYRARKSRSTVGEVDADELWRRADGLCEICSESLTDETQFPDPYSPSLDHRVPLSKGGTHAMENLAFVHLICNVRKGARPIN